MRSRLVRTRDPVSGLISEQLLEPELAPVEPESDELRDARANCQSWRVRAEAAELELLELRRACDRARDRRPGALAGPSGRIISRIARAPHGHPCMCWMCAA